MTKKSTEKYPDLALLEATILKHLTPDLCAPAYRVLWSDENPTLGFCSVASEAAWFLLGGGAVELDELRGPRRHGRHALVAPKENRRNF